MGKDDKCCVPFCGNRRKVKRSLSYYRIPQNPAQRVAWLEAIRKDPATLTANDRICSVHFVSGKPSPFSQNVDWKPTVGVDVKDPNKDPPVPTANVSRQVSVAVSQHAPPNLHSPPPPIIQQPVPQFPAASPSISHQNRTFVNSSPPFNQKMEFQHQQPFSPPPQQMLSAPSPSAPLVHNQMSVKRKQPSAMPPPPINSNTFEKTEMIPPQLSNENSLSESGPLLPNTSDKGFSSQNNGTSSSPPLQGKHENFVCVLCNEKLPSKEALQEHFRCHANGEGFVPVRVMDRPIASANNGLNPPNISGVGTETWTCDICKGRVFTSKSTYLTHHMRYHPQETGHFCPHCGRMFPLRVDRDRHLQNHPDRGPYTKLPCSVCKADFYNPAALKYHMQNHQKVQEITNRVNDSLEFIDDIRPSKRLRFDSTGEPQFCYYCPWCGKEYIQKYNLESHVRKMHQTMAKAERLFYCETCDSTFYNQSALMQHNFGHQQNQGYLLNPEDMCKAKTFQMELDDEVNMLSQILPVAAANPTQAVASTGSEGNEGNVVQAWPDWMNALPQELLRAIKQEPSSSENNPPSLLPDLPLGPIVEGNVEKTPLSAFPCNECGGNFPTMVALKQHRCLPGKDNPMIKKDARCDLTCGVCSSSFSSSSELAEHLVTHEVYLCSECGEEMPNKSKYLEHKSQHSNGELRIPLNMFLPENEELRRKILGLKTESVKSMKDPENSEIKTEKESKTEISDDMKLSATEESKDDRNIKKDKGKDSDGKENEQFVCGLCDQHFPDQASLEIHFREMGDHASHNSRFSVTCNVCGLSFTVEAFKKHTHSRPFDSNRSSGGNSIPIKCGICQENFSTKEEIDAHFASHPETARDVSRRSFLCNVCVAEDPALALLTSFSTLRELYDHHARQHPQTSSNYQCRLCGMRFFEQWDLASHFAKHLPENIRNQCQVVFKNGQLKATFVCERCGQVFNYEVHLANHLRNNTCLKWACHICGRGNRSAKHRNQHIREYHPVDGLRYLCGVADCSRKEAFAKRSHVYAHIRSKHPEIVQNSSDRIIEELDIFVIEENLNLKKDTSAEMTNTDGNVGLNSSFTKVAENEELNSAADEKNDVGKVCDINT